MSLLKLVPETDPILLAATELFDFSNPPVDPVQLAADMLETMRHERGIGLAAPQVGLPYRVFVMEINDVEYACFNPEIVSLSEETAVDNEGCLSFPNLWLDVTRPLSVEVRYTDAHGNLVNEKFESLAARCYLHETDHLNGVRFVTLVSPLKLERALKRRIKFLRGY